MKKPSIQNFTIIIDKQEKRLGIRGYNFKTIKPDPPLTIRAHLKTGDYSIKGLENKITVERKTLTDLFGSTGNERKRFEREFERMKNFEYSALVIESSLAGIFTNPSSRSKMNPKVVFRTLISWSIKYGVCVWPAWNREAAERVTYLILKRYYDDYVKNLDK
jgi:ERCC4-type nuclease